MNWESETPRKPTLAMWQWIELIIDNRNPITYEVSITTLADQTKTSYRHTFRMVKRVRTLLAMRNHSLVIIDETHNRRPTKDNLADYAASLLD